MSDAVIVCCKQRSEREVEWVQLHCGDSNECVINSKSVSSMNKALRLRILQNAHMQESRQKNSKQNKTKQTRVHTKGVL